MPPHPLTNLEIQNYFKDEPRFNGAFSRNNLPKTRKNGPYVIHLDHSKNTGSHWVVLLVKSNEVIYFNSFGVEHLPIEIKKFIGNRDVKSNIFRIQDYNSILCDYFCILFIKLMLDSKTLTDFTNLFSLTDLKNGRINRRKKLLGLINSVFSLISCLRSGIINKLYQKTKLRNKKHNRLLNLAKNKLYCVEMLVSKSVQDGIIDHNEILGILEKKEDYDCLKSENKISEVEIV